MGSNPINTAKKVAESAYKDLTGILQNAASTPPAQPPPDPVLEDQSALVAQNRLREDVKRRRASQTLFTGGSGLTDTPSTASSVLLGY